MSRPPTDYSAFDEVVVVRLVTNRHTGGRIHPADAGEACRRLAEAGFTDGQIALRLGCWRRTVIRIRRRLGISAALRPNQNFRQRRHDVPGRPVAAG